VNEPSEKAFLAYFEMLARQFKPSTLWTKYSMLNTCLKCFWGHDLKTALPQLGLFTSNHA